MTTYNKISTLVQSQFPSFVIEEGPALIAFIQAYYEWLEQNGNLIDRTKNILSYQDIDETLDDFIQYFRDEIFVNFSDDALVDKRLFAKQVRELYRMKGTEKAFKFLFRALYNEDIDLYYPGDYILRTSDGRWQQDTVIRLIGISLMDGQEMEGQIVTGETSGAFGRVEKVQEVFELGILVVELTLSNIVGTFIDNETVTSDISGTTGTIYSTSGSLQDIIIQKSIYNLPRGAGAGLFHRQGDVLTFTSDAGSGANAIVVSTNDKSAINVEIIAGGSGYVNNLPITFSGGSGFNAVAKVTSIGNTEVLSICTDTIYAMRNVVLGTGPTFVSAGANTSAVSANLASANIYSSIISGTLFSNVTTGTITSISMTNYGIDYSILPRVTAINANVANENIVDPNGGFKGKNANLRAINLPGSITKISVNSKGAAYSRNENIGLVNQTRVDTINALGTPVVSGIEVKSGYYNSTKGFLSWDQRLQDGNFYQEFSYVIRSSQFIDSYRNIVKQIVHPSGTKLFGEILIISPFVAYVNGEVELSFDSNIITNLTLNNANTSNVVSVVDPPYNQSPGLLFIFNYSTLDPFLQPTVGTGVSTTINAFGEIAVGDLNSSKLVFGNNTTFNSNGSTLSGYVRQSLSSSNTLIGNGGTNFSLLSVGDTIYATNTSDATSNFVRVVSIGGASSMVTSPSINTTSIGFQYSSNTSNGAILKMPPALLDTYDVVIFDTYGGTADGQYAVNVVSSAVNTVFTISANYAGNTLSNGSFSYIDPGIL